MMVSGWIEIAFGISALAARNDLDGAGGLAAAYGLGLYNVVAAVALLFAAVSAGGAGLWAGALLHSGVGALFAYALVMRGGQGG